MPNSSYVPLKSEISCKWSKRVPRRYITLPADLTTFDLLQSVKNS